MTHPTYQEILEAEVSVREDIRDDADRAAYLAESEVRSVLASRYDPPADPQRRLSDGTIVCWDCEAAIPRTRLAAQPHAVRCIDCQRAAESVHRHSPRSF